MGHATKSRPQRYEFYFAARAGTSAAPLTELRPVDPVTGQALASPAELGLMARKFYFSLLIIAPVVAAAAPAASARKARCTPDPGSPRCHFWYGQVKLVADGDTIDVDLFGDHTHELERVRFTGIN